MNAKPRGPTPAAGTFAVAAGVLLASMLIMYSVGRAAVESGRRVATLRAVLHDVELLTSTLADAETGQRGYLLTGDARFLGPHDEALARIRAEQDALRRWAAAGELPAPEVEKLLALTHVKLNELERAIRLRRDVGPEAALDVVRSGDGGAAMSAIRARVEGLGSALEGSIERESRRAATFIGVRTATFMAAGLTNLAFLAWAFRRLSAEMSIREAAARDISREKERLQTTLASIGDGVILTDVEGRVTFLNAEAERLTAWTSAEAAGLPLSRVLPIVDSVSGRPAENPVDKVLRLGKVVGLSNHTELVSKTGERIPIDDSAAPIREPGGALFGIVLIFRDFREQRKAEEARARLAAIVKSSADAILSKDLNGTILTWNEGAQRLFGYRAEEMIGKPITLLIPTEHVREEEEILARLRQGKPSEYHETVRLTKDGRRVRVSVSVSPLKDHEGRVMGASKIVRDIEDMVAAREVLARGREELERLVEERTGKLKEVIREMEAFTYTVAHDLRAPLRAIAGCSELLIEEHAGDLSRGSGPEYLRRISSGARKMDELIRDLLEYSHLTRTDLKIERTSLDKAVAESLVQLEDEISNRRAVVAVERPPLPDVQAHPSTLRQVLVNLISNGLKFVLTDVQPRITIKSETRRSRIRLWVEDNGIGIEEAYRERIFRVFERLNRPEDYPGTGIGLAIVRRAMERMGGRCGVESTPGQGSRFWIELPEVSAS